MRTFSFFFGLHLILWIGVGYIEHNWLIPAFAALLAFVSVVITHLLGGGRGALKFLSVGLVLRTAVCALAWYQSKGTEFSFWTGLNEDSNRYFLNSYLPKEEAIYTTEDKGFPYINSLVTEYAAEFGVDHYLVNVQLPLISGILLAVATYVLGRQLTNEKSARIAGWLIALNPIVIGWSSGLMRDTVGAAAGWIMVYEIVSLFGTNRRRLWIKIPMLIGSGSLAWSIRSMTFFFLLVVAIVILVFNSKSLLSALVRNLPILVTGFILAAFILYQTNVWDRFDRSWQYGVASRAAVGVDDTTVNAGGISAKMAEKNSLIPYLLVAPYSFVAPFPVYTIPSGFNGEPGRLVDYLFNLGGLLNLYCFILLICGLLAWWREKKYGLLIVAGPIFYGILVLLILGAGQSRWMMGFGYPTVFLSVAHVLVIIWNSPHRRAMFEQSFLILCSVYISYWLLKSGVGAYIVAGSMGLLLVSLCIVFLGSFDRILKLEIRTNDE